MSSSDFATLLFNGKECHVDVKHNQHFKKLEFVDLKLRNRKVTLICLNYWGSTPATVQTIDWIDDDDNQHGRAVPAEHFVSFQDIKNKKPEATVYAVSKDFLYFEIVGKATIVKNPLA